MKNLLVGLVTCLSVISIPVNSATIDTTTSWNGQTFISTFGENNTATYGQTFTVGSDTQLDSFTFYVNDKVNPDFIDFQAYVYAWDGTKASGATLYQSSAMSTTNNGGVDGMEAFTIKTGGITLATGSEYVSFFSASNLFDGSIGNGVMGGFHSGNPYSLGNFVYMNNGANFSQLTSRNWTQWTNVDLAFRMEFSQSSATSVPEPGTLPLLGIAMMGMLGFNRRKV